MVAKSSIEIGDVIGRLTLIKRLPRKTYTTTRWLCQCSCGTQKDVAQIQLVAGKVRSCGCLRRDVWRAKMTTHGMTNDPRYGIWGHIKYRCTNPADSEYHAYGGRGIRVCDRWMNDFQAFVLDMGPRPTPQHSIERIDNDGNYEPSNCRWATRLEQAANKRNTIRLTLNGETKRLVEWAAIYGLPHTVLATRIKNGWNAEDAITIRRMKRSEARRGRARIAS